MYDWARLLQRRYPLAPQQGTTVRIRVPRALLSVGPTRYCQRCSTPTTVYLPGEQPNPCRSCGGTQFGAHPKPHANSSTPWQLTAEDVVMLRVQGIDPEGY